MIATVTELFVYPVKSMAGVAVEEAHVGLDGILGDRQYSFVQANQSGRSSFPWMTARESARMLLYRPSFRQSPTPGEPEPALEVRTPDGAVFEPDHPALRDELTGAQGPLYLLKSSRGIFDNQHVSLFSLASVRALAEQAGCPIDRRQFRANVYLEPASGAAFEEEGWAGQMVQIGEQVILSIVQRDTRCMMINLNPETGEQNPQVLRAVAQRHEGQAGVYANVVRPGVIRVGDPIRRISQTSD